MSSVNEALRGLNTEVLDEVERLNSPHGTADILFLVYLRRLSHFGYFSFGPINIDLRVIEDIVERTVEKAPPGFERRQVTYSDDFIHFTQRLAEEMARSGRRRIDELHFLLAFMRLDEGLPKRVFGELGVSPEQVEAYARSRATQPAASQKLYSPEEAAEYLNVHVQTVRSWIRSGRLRARRLAGQRALRITASDLESVLEPLDSGEAD
jgi:excisionase family DNA binding protein